MNKRIFIGLTAALILLGAYALFYTPSGAPVKKIIVSPGMTAGELVDILHAEGIYGGKRLLRSLLHLSGAGRRMKPGLYSFSESSGLWEVYRKISRFETDFVRFTVPEGYGKEELAALFAARLSGRSEEFIKEVEARNLEGYLFPETYFFAYGTPAKTVIDSMLAEFKKRAGEISRRELILASLVEKEAKSREDKRMVAAVFLNRLKKGWLLESCATVRYAKKKYKEKLTYNDLKVKSTFNTYIHPGVPPAPICNPGLDSIEAVRNPAETDSLFFVLDKETGTHNYSRYYEDHVRKKGTVKWKTKQK